MCASTNKAMLSLPSCSQRVQADHRQAERSYLRHTQILHDPEVLALLRQLTAKLPANRCCVIRTS